MPIIYSVSDSPKFKILVSENTEALDYFTSPFQGESILAELESLKPGRQIEILSSHILIAQLMQAKTGLQFQKDEYGKPHLLHGSQHMSISHSFDRSCAIISSCETGIDIQKSVDKIKRIQTKFLSADELNFIKPEFEMQMLHVLWGAKEAMYKAYGKKKVDFKTELSVAPFQYKPGGGIISGQVIKDSYDGKFSIHYQTLEDYFIVFALRDDMLIM